MFGVDDQQRCCVVFVKDAAIAFAQAMHIVFRNAGFHRNAALLDAIDQGLWFGLQIDDEIRQRCLRTQVIIQLLVERQLIVAQRQARKDRVFVEQEIGDDTRIE